MNLYEIKYFSKYTKKWETHEITKNKKTAFAYKTEMENRGHRIKIIVLKTIKT